MGVRYADAAGTGQKWQDFVPVLRSTHPQKDGYYTVVTSRRCHWWVEEGYQWTGAYWKTAHGTTTTSVIKFAPDSYSEKRPSKANGATK